MTPEEEWEMRCLRQEAKIAHQAAELTTLRKQVADLTRMHKNDQQYIGKLQAQNKRDIETLAEQVFKDE